MNASTVIVLIVLAALLALAVRYLVRQQRAKKCAGCSEGSCGTGEGGAACPMAERAVAEVEERLDAKK